MSRSSSASSFDLYQTVTDQILAMLDRGVTPWRCPILGKASAGHPVNLASRKKYRGVNVFLLAVTAWAKGYESSNWLTFNQARERGGNVRKGEKSSLVVFWKPLEVTDRETGEKKETFVLRYYNVFNAVQCEGITIPDAPVFTPSELHPVEAAERIVHGYANAPEIHRGGSKAFYRPSVDEVHVPEPTRFASTNEFYSTLFHELAHSTGHSSRLDRKLDTDPKPFGTPDYSREELVAEMAAAFLCGEADIVPSVIENQAAYLQGWINVLKGDKKLVIAAAGAAQRAADWILGERKPVGTAAEAEPVTHAASD
ncbi:MAG: zincin-like metallopeptidase domain-containing protein [Tepidisphaeraceae bacterium]